MQHPPSFPLRRRPKRCRRAQVMRQRRRFPKRRSLLQLRKREIVRSGNKRQKVAARVVGDGDGKEETEMEAVNMKLYLQNRCIMEENERLRKRALALRHENQLLLSQLRPQQQLVLAVNKNSSCVDGGDEELLPAQHHH